MTLVCQEHIKAYDELKQVYAEDGGQVPWPYDRHWQLHKKDENLRMKRVLGPTSEDRVFVKATYQYSVARLQQKNAAEEEEEEEGKDANKLTEAINPTDKNKDTIDEDRNDDEEEEERRKETAMKETFYAKKTRQEWLRFLKVSSFHLLCNVNLPIFVYIFRHG